MVLIQIGSFFKNWMTRNGFSVEMAENVRDITDFIIAVVIILVLYYVLKYIVISIIRKVVRRSNTTWDDALFNNKVFNKALLLVPGLMLAVVIPVTLSEFPVWMERILLVTQIYIVAVIISLLNAFLNAIYDIYQGFEVSKSKPIKGYLQVFKIVLFIIGAIFVISMLIGKSPIYLLGGLGAFSAVLLLIFRDPILGLVGGIQMSVNDMVRPGDWIVMDKSGADGMVIDISLTTVKVQNWDKTITTIPTYSLVSESFINWRGMEESGGRRIKRSINIDMNSVKFASGAQLEKFKKIQLIREYLNHKEKELSAYNEKNKIDDGVLVNGRRQTNLGIFRAYISAYLRSNPNISQEMTFLVRQLQPGASGIPLEIYVFSKIQAWALYEDIQSDIFDHLLATIPEFGLQVFQNPSGADFRRLGERLSDSQEPGGSSGSEAIRK
ncbi:MAG: mechanosensitive ion channel [Lentimicrobiaceae bacterium]|nr:mechanosensitive ion channel [Lentimicrobiaceae bacterium]